MKQKMRVKELLVLQSWVSYLEDELSPLLLFWKFAYVWPKLISNALLWLKLI